MKISDMIPENIIKYSKTLLFNSMDYNYTPCSIQGKILFAVLTEYFQNKNGCKEKYTFFSGKELQKDIDRQKVQKREKEQLYKEQQRKIYALKQRGGVYQFPFFIESQVGKLDIYNKNKIKLILKRKMNTVNERLCEDECMKLNEVETGYSSLVHATNSGWSILKKTNHFIAKEFQRIDGSYCSCFGTVFQLKK
jgi:hypothetical protein